MVAQGNNFYATFNEPLQQNCLYDVVYILGNKNLYAQLLAAKASDKPITRIDYTQDGDGQECHVNLVEF